LYAFETVIRDTPASAATVSSVGRAVDMHAVLQVTRLDPRFDNRLYRYRKRQSCIGTELPVAADRAPDHAGEGTDAMSITPHELGTLLGYLGSALGVTMVIPQIVRTLANRRLTGVSALSWGLLVFSCSGWLLYGIKLREIVQIPGNVLLVSGAVAVVLLVPSRVPSAIRALALATGLSAYALLATVVPADAVVVFAIAIGQASAIPQVVQSVRRSSHERSAVSLSTWRMRVASQACWLGFALLTHEWVVLASALITQTCNVSILVMESRRAATVHHDVEASAALDDGAGKGVPQLSTTAA
jgi:uncharacterized protein with PQ loop repeat